jgi:DNA-binding GntR family transcriptional regulator
MIGTSREEVTRALQLLREQRLVDYRAHRTGIVVRDTDALEGAVVFPTS